jgi:hypothetical protein
MSYVQWRNTYFFFVHLSIILIVYWSFSQASSVKLGRCIFSVYVWFRYCLAGSLLVH